MTQKITLPKHLFDWMTLLPVIDGSHSTNVPDEFGLLLNFELDLKTS